MTEPVIIAALISLISIETAAFVGYFLRRNNRKNNNPGFEIAAREALTRIEGMLEGIKDALERIERKMEG